MKFLFFVITLSVLTVSSTGFSQESETTIGLGVSLNPTALFSSSSFTTLFLPVGLTNIYVPITIGEKFRIEPEAGIYSQSSENSTDAILSNTSSTLFRLGVGLFKIYTYDETFLAYVGPRIGILSSSSTWESTGSTTTTTKELDLFIGLATGGEHSLSPHFSIGGEVQLNYVSFGNPVRTPASSTWSETKQSMFTNNALMFFRWHF